ncbi:MAG: hypothetical protein GXN92_02940 [Candidatus Micrarchaeota archaeon]|nr:hypothetical protein [Candidatus Micrarchaeota archaeon]
MMECLKKALDDYFHNLGEYIFRMLVAHGVITAAFVVAFILGTMGLIVMGEILFFLLPEGLGEMVLLMLIIGLMVILALLVIVMPAPLWKYWVLLKKDIEEAFKSLNWRSALRLIMGNVLLGGIIVTLWIGAGLMGGVYSFLGLIMGMGGLLLMMVVIAPLVYLWLYYDELRLGEILKKGLKFLLKRPLDSFLLVLVTLINKSLFGLLIPLHLLTIKKFEEGECNV